MAQKNSTLLNKALRTERGTKSRKITPEHADLVVAFYNDEISVMQFATAIGTSRGNAYCIAMTMLRSCVASGMVKVLKS